jgi:hypothetical protein
MVPCANTTGHSAVYIGVSASKIIMKALFRKLSHDTSFKFYFALPLISLNLHLAKLQLRFFASSFAKQRAFAVWPAAAMRPGTFC